MKIGNPADKRNVAQAEAAASAKAAEANKAPAAGSAAADPSAKVELSSAATLLSGNDTATFDADKVAQISQAIADGSYKVNADVIADKLIANAQELLGKVQR